MTIIVVSKTTFRVFSAGKDGKRGKSAERKAKMKVFRIFRNKKIEKQIRKKKIGLKESLCEKVFSEIIPANRLFNVLIYEMNKIFEMREKEWSFVKLKLIDIRMMKLH